MKSLQQWWYQPLLRLLSWVIEKESVAKGSLTPDQERGLLALLWENQAFRDYLDTRERRLIDGGMDRFIEGKITDARGLSGQLIEIRNMRTRIKGAWLTQKTVREAKREALAKGK